MRMIHEGAAMLHLEFVGEGLAWRNMRLVEAAHPVHAVRQEYPMPVYGGLFRQLVGDEDAELVAFDRLDCRARRLAVVAPQMGLHTFRELAHHRFSDQVEFLPVAVHAPRQRPTIQCHHWAVIRTAGRMQRWLHRRLLHDRRFGNACGLDAAADRRRADKRGGAEKASAG